MYKIKFNMFKRIYSDYYPITGLMTTNTKCWYPMGLFKLMDKTVAPLFHGTIMVNIIVEQHCNAFRFNPIEC